MNSLDNNWLIVLNGEKGVILPLSHPRDKIIPWDLDFLTGKETNHILIKEFCIQCINGFVIILPLFIQRGILTVEEIIIQRDHYRAKSIDTQLYPQSLSEGGLPGRGRPRNQDQSDMLPMRRNMIGNLCNSLFL